MPVLLNLIYRFKVIMIKIPGTFFVDENFCRRKFLDEIFLIFIWKGKGNRIANTILKNKNKVGGISLPDV